MRTMLQHCNVSEDIYLSPTLRLEDRKKKRYILSRIQFGTISKLALVTTHSGIGLLAALPAVSTFSKSL